MLKKFKSLLTLIIFLVIFGIIFLSKSVKYFDCRIIVNKFKFKPNLPFNQFTIETQCNQIIADDILNYGIENRFPNNSIPKIVHYTYQDNHLPIQYESLIRQCYNINRKDNILYVLWSDDSFIDLIKTFYLDKLNIMQSYFSREKVRLKITDIMRPFILHKFGGIYMDLDTRCQDTFTKAFKMDARYHDNIYSSCILTTDINVKIEVMYNINQLAMNSFMACVPGHNFFKLVIENIKTNNFKEPAVILTGPFFINKQFNRYISEPQFGNISNLIEFSVNNNIRSQDIVIKPRESISLAHWKVYSPFIDLPYLPKLCHKLIGVHKIRSCKALGKFIADQKKDIAAAPIVHLFMHLEYSGIKGSIKKTFDSCKSTPFIKYIEQI